MKTSRCIIGLWALAWLSTPPASGQPHSAFQLSDDRTASDSGVSPSARGSLHGLVVPTQQVTMSAPLEGVLTDVYVEEGQQVQKGQALAEMDVRVAAASVRVARLRADDDESVRHAQLEVKHAKLRLLRTAESHKANAATDFEVREAKLLFDQAKAALEAATRVKAVAAAALELETERLGQHKVVAPFSGRVVRVFAHPGATMTTSDSLLTIVSLHELEAHIHLPVDQYGKLKEGDIYCLYAEAPVGRVLKARLKMMTPVIESASQTFRCVFTMDNPDPQLPAGFSVRFLADGEASGPGGHVSR